MTTPHDHESHLVTDEPDFETGLPELGAPMPAIDEAHAKEPRAAGPYPPVPGHPRAESAAGQHLRGGQWSDGTTRRI